MKNVEIATPFHGKWGLAPFICGPIYYMQSVNINGLGVLQAFFLRQ